MTALTPYVPRLAAEWDQWHPGAQWFEQDVTCCFVDISGFTALSERLARLGRMGAEELTEVLNHVFSRMLAVAYDKGGGLLKFGGDALLLAFTRDDHPRLAAQAAVAMRAALREARTLPTSVGRVNLRMSVGLHSGSFHFFRVGSSHRELIVTGPAATMTTRMEQQADAGQIVVSKATAARLPPTAVGPEKGEGRILRWRRVVEDGPGPAIAPAGAELDPQMWLSAILRTRLTDRVSESEHRLANIGFVKFQGIDDLLDSSGPAETAESLDAVVGAIQEAADSEGVTFLASDIDANGGKIILATGVPLSNDDDEGRLLRAARAIVEGKLPLPVKIGANRGHVFAGDIGTQFRRTFTVMGDTVNLAARLMAAAPSGSLLATAAILDHSRTRFETRALEPFMVKGKSRPVEAFEVGAPAGVRSSSAGSLPFRGRDKELATLRDAVGEAHAGRGTVCVIEAERGAGKSRLISEVTSRSDGPRVLILQGEPYGRALPYLPLREPLRRVLGIDATDRNEAGSQLLSAFRTALPDLIPFTPLVAPLLEADLPATPESAAVAEQFVRDRVADLVVSILDRLCPGPITVLAEDGHWFDDTSSDICNRIATEVRSRPWFLCVTRRPGTGGFNPTSCDLHLTLAPIADDAASSLVDASTENAPLRPHERDGLVARAGGNPLFLEELIRVVRTTDIEAIPDSLDAVAMREIDALPSSSRRVLRLSSVLGGSFDEVLLSRFLRDEQIDISGGLPGGLDDQLVPDGHGRLRFRHALLREAAYESLPFRTRLALHRKAGALIEEEARDLDRVAPVLSMHFSEARDWARTWRYGRRAAEVARRAYALAEVVSHMERAAAAARHLDDVDDRDVASLLMDLGETLLVLGDYERADDAYRRSTLASRGDPLRRANTAERRAHVRRYQGRLSAAMRQVRTGSALLDGLGGDDDAERTRAKLLAREAEVRNLQGRLPQAITQCLAAISEAERVGERPALALALGILDISYMQLGRLDDATHMTRALELYEELGDGVNVAATLACLGAMSYYATTWGKAVDFYARSAEAASAAGDQAHAAIAHANLAEIRVNQGRLAEAADLLVPVQRTLESFGFREMAAWALMQLGRAHAFLGDVDGGAAMIRSALATFDDIESLTASVESRAILGEVLTFGGELSAAAVAVEQARALEGTLGETPLAALLDRVEVTLGVASGDREATIARLDRSLERARSMAASYDLLVLLALANRLGAGDGAEEAARLRRDLGVVALPMLSTL